MKNLGQKNDNAYKKIIADWKLTKSDPLMDYIIVMMNTYFQENPYALMNKQTLIDVSKRAVGRLINGVGELNKDALESCERIIVVSIEYEIGEEVKRRMRSRELEEELVKWSKKREKRHDSNPPDKRDSTDGGMYA